ncbi:hypothetical protein CEV31_2781 [Brucella thiophenivorans]|uniref:Uncharacterized protein n=1 Tax=Brucella thiophenivorans TaxID=571255 RepID=A0A256FLD1_9HYPH|nr:hypothetical protein CEV31_2781 [Brucella thiophenivorans]
MTMAVQRSSHGLFVMITTALSGHHSNTNAISIHKMIKA